MSDPSTLAAGTIAGVIAIQTGTLIGIPFDTLAIGFAAALFVTMWLEKMDSLLKSAASVLFSCMLAGFMAPIVGHYLVHHYPDLALAPDNSILIRACAFGIGAITPFGFPLLLSIMRRKGDGL